MRVFQHADGGYAFADENPGEPDWTYIGDVSEGARTEYCTVVDGEIVGNMPLAREGKWREIKAARDAARYGGCATPLGRMDTTEESQRLLTSAVGLATIIGSEYSVDWTMEDNTVVAHDAGAICGAGIAVGIWVAACQSIGTTLRNQIMSATTLAEIDAVAWPS